MEENHTPERKKIIHLNEEAVRDHLGEIVRNTVEETLNGMLNAEAERLCNAEKYENFDLAGVGPRQLTKITKKHPLKRAIFSSITSFLGAKTKL